MQQAVAPVKPVPNEHLCLDCGTDISDRRLDAKRCEACAYIRAKERANNYYRNNRAKVLRRVKNHQRTPEHKQRRQEWEQENPDLLKEYRRRQRQKHREKTGYNPEGRTCRDCGADISHMGHRAKRCRPCSTPPPRTCKACRADISHRGPRAEYCNDVCRRRYWQAKELIGYTKTCTQCEETMEHTEFGWHNGFRRSTCRRCEVKSQSERFHNFTPEQISRRNQRKRELGQTQRANLTPSERAILNAKARQAKWQKLFGPDFDINSLYTEQEGKCAICDISKTLRGLEVDHKDGAKWPRGLLCKNCNFKLLSRYERFPKIHQDSLRLNAYLLRGKRR